MSANVETSGFVGRVLGDRWIVGEQLGSGTFGVVHAGVERGTGQPIAVKLLHPQFLHHGETIARFWNEAEALRRMNHPNVLVLLDVGVTDDGVPYLITELLTGETLRDLLNREGPLPAERAMRLLGPAAHALHHAHMMGIVHRDLKPENIFRVRKDGMGTTKILDFGVAKLLDTTPGRKLSQTGIMIGTMAYSPPEQMQGLGDIDHRADQFGFAALMFEALTGQRPFPQAQPFALFQAVMSGQRPRATDLIPTLPRAVDDVLIRALDPDRTRRYENVEEFYLALSQALTTPAYQGLSTTFNGAAPAPQRPASMAPPAQVPVSAYPPVERELSNRFRAIDEESTRSEHSPVEDARSKHPPRGLTTTLQSGSMHAPTTMPEGAAPSLHTTLVQGTAAPRSIPAPPVSTAFSSAPPPVSAERPISRQEPALAPAPPPQIEAPAASRGGLVAAVLIVVVAVIIAVLIVVLRH